MLEAAIPHRLQVERTVPSKAPPNYEPPFPAYFARFPESTKDLVMAIIGSQHQDTAKGNLKALQKLISFTTSSPKECKPSFVDYASVVDPQHAYNQCVIAYWPSVALYQQWSDMSGFKKWWKSLDAEKEEHGWFLEVFLPPLE